MKLWEIVKLATEGKLEKGDKFKGLELPLLLIIEFDGDSLIYNTIMDDTTSKNTVTLCSGELDADFVKI